MFAENPHPGSYPHLNGNEQTPFLFFILKCPLTSQRGQTENVCGSVLYAEDSCNNLDFPLLKTVKLPRLE